MREWSVHEVIKLFLSDASGDMNDSVFRYLYSLKFFFIIFFFLLSLYIEWSWLRKAGAGVKSGFE